MHFQRVEIWLRAGKRFLGGCVWVCFAYQELAGSMGIPDSQWSWGILRRVRGPHQSRGPRDNPRSGLCLSPSACPLAAPPWRGPHGPESWNWPLLCPPKSLMKKLELLFWKLSKKDLDALLSLKNWWENRCQNPVVDLANLPAPKISREICWERWVEKDKCLFSWLALADVTPLSNYFFLPYAFLSLPTPKWMVGMGRRNPPRDFF